MVSKKTTIIKAYSQGELDRRVKDSKKRGMIEIKRGIDKKPDRFVYWAKMEIE